MRNQIIYLLVITLFLCIPVHAEYDWVRVSTEYNPPRKDSHNMIFNITDQTSVMFAGYASLKDTPPIYVYDGFNWEIISSSSSGPVPRAHFGMAYDAFRDVVVLFGGFVGGSDYLGDTWEWDGSQWEEKLPVTHPEDRSGCSMTYNSMYNCVCLFGGYTDSFEVTNELWTWDGVDWVEVSSDEGPVGRLASQIVFDSSRNRIVLFGGTDNGSTELSDTWEWDGVEWIENLTPNHPTGKRGHSLVYDSNREVCVLFGGNDEPVGLSNETWEYDGVDWQQINTQHKPSKRSATAACYDAHRQRIVLYGGYTETGSNNETWEYYDVPIPTVTPSPTVTSSPSPTPPPTVTPTSTATPQDGITLSLDLPDNPVHTGDAFYLDISINSNHSSDLSSMPMFCILEVAGSFWYYPTWEMTPSWETITVHPGNQIVPILPEFLWPADCGSGTARFWAALTDMEITRIFGNVDVRDVVWEE